MPSLAARTACVIGCAAMVVGVAGGCGDDNPPPLGSVTSHVEAGPPVFNTDAGGPPDCTKADPEAGVCGCTELDLLGDAPNMYFVLDRSGSMANGNEWTTVRTVVSQTMEKIGPRASFGVAVFPKPGQQCAAGGQVMSVRRGDSPAGTFGPTTKVMLQVTSAAPSGGTPTAATLRALTPTLEGLAGQTFVILATDGGPNCNDSATCGASECQLNIEGMQGCPPGGPLDCCDPSSYGPEFCLDAQPTIDAVSALAAASIPTYVIGVPGSETYAALLDQLATAGGTARAGSPRYYRVDTTDAADFAAALAKVAAKITATCTLSLDQPPPDPDQVNVYLDGVAVPQDPTDGWSLDGATVTLLGATCQKVMAGDVLSLRVVAGCPTLKPN